MRLFYEGALFENFLAKYFNIPRNALLVFGTWQITWDQSSCLNSFLYLVFGSVLDLLKFEKAFNLIVKRLSQCI